MLVASLFGVAAWACSSHDLPWLKSIFATPPWRVARHSGGSALQRGVVVAYSKSVPSHQNVSRHNRWAVKCDIFPEQ
jgi:hypothetical protein